MKFIVFALIALLVAGCAGTVPAANPSTDDPLAGIEPSKVQTIKEGRFTYLVTHAAGPVTPTEGWSLLGVVEQTSSYVAFIAFKDEYKVFEVDAEDGVLFYVLSKDGKVIEWGGNKEYRADLKES